MLELNITIPGKPIGKMSARKGKYGTWYNPQKKTKDIVQRLIKEQLFQGFKPAPKGVPVIINMVAFFSPNATELKNKKFMDKIKNDDYPYLKKYDKDNLTKFYLDAMTKIIYYDDNQVYDGRTTKFYSLNPRTEIQIIF